LNEKITPINSSPNFSHS